MYVYCVGCSFESIPYFRKTPATPSLTLSRSITMAGFITKAADLAHKVVVLGLASVAGFQLYQIGRNAFHGIDESKRQQNPKQEYLEILREKVAEDYKKHDDISHRDWYEKDDNSYLDDAPKPPRPVKKG